MVRGVRGHPVRRDGAVEERSSLRLPALAWLYVSTVIVIGTGAVVAVTSRSSRLQFVGHRPALTVVLLAGLLVTELRPLSWLRGEGDVRVTGSWVFAVGLLCCGASTTAALGLGGLSVLNDCLDRRGTVRAAFNGAQSFLSVVAGAAVLVLVERDAVTMLNGTGVVTLRATVAILLAAATAYVVNSGTTSIAMALSLRLPVLDALARTIWLNLSTDGVLLCLAPVLVVVANRSLFLLPFIMVALGAVYSHARLALLRDRAARHDALTGLPNRRHYLDALNTAIEERDRVSSPLAIALLDLTGFKQVNDQHGHAAGDEVLKAVADRLWSAAQPDELVARLGGDEFALMFDSPGSEADVLARVEAYVEALRAPIRVRGIDMDIRGNIGIASFPDDGLNSTDLLESADSAMYTAKYDGIPVFLARTSSDRRRGRSAITLDVEHALRNDELRVVYQPIVDVAGEVCAAEALVRWQHPDQGLLLPGAFVPQIENSRLMTELTHFVLERATSDAMEWHRAGRTIDIAVNVAAQDFRDATFPSFVASVLRQTGLPAGSLEIELTEGALALDASGTAVHTARALKDLGVQLSLDDFGTGYATLAALRDMPFDILKIDRSFVQRSPMGRDRVIVATVIDLARKLGLRTTIEGVEDATTWEELCRSGCDRIQGWAISRALDADSLLRFSADQPHRALEVAR